MNNDSHLIYEAYNRRKSIAIVTMGNPENPIPGDTVIFQWKTLRPIYNQIRVWTDDEKIKFHDMLKEHVLNDEEIALWKDWTLDIMYYGSIESYPYRKRK